MVYLLKVIIMILLLLALLLLSLLKVRNTTLVAGNGLTYLTLPIKHKIFIVIQKQKSLKVFYIFFYREKEISKKSLHFYHEIVTSKSFLYNLQAEILTHSLGQRQNFLYFPRISNFSNQKLFTSVWKSRFFTRRKNLW